MWLTKSDYVKYHQCRKYLWLNKHRKDLLPTEKDLDLERRFREGEAIEKIALKIRKFHGAADCGTANFFDGPKRTARLIEQGESVLYQPAFQLNNLYARCDILVKNGDVWDIYEIKSATKPKDEHFVDIAFQAYVLRAAGLTVGRMYVLHVNNEYVRSGDIDARSYFREADVTAEARAVLETLDDGVVTAKNIIYGRQTMPEVRILRQCDSPYECPFKDFCWKGIPERNIYELRYGAEEIAELLDRGIVRLEDIPEGKLTANNRDHWYWETARSGETRIRPTEIAEALVPLQYPIYYLDYEAYGSAIPPFDGYRPHQYIPFQFSLHVQAKPGGATKHFEFLADEFMDPVPALGAALQEWIGPKGSVVAWNSSFEERCNNLVAERVPELADFIAGVNVRLFDPIGIVRGGSYYDAELHNSASLKAVVPVLVPELSYSDLEIHEGGTAMASWPQLCAPDIKPRDKSKLKKAMLEYCKRDTITMVVIIDKFREMAGLEKPARKSSAKAGRHGKPGQASLF